MDKNLHLHIIKYIMKLCQIHNIKMPKVVPSIFFKNAYIKKHKTIFYDPKENDIDKLEFMIAHEFYHYMDDVKKINNFKFIKKFNFKKILWFFILNFILSLSYELYISKLENQYNFFIFFILTNFYCINHIFSKSFLDYKMNLELEADKFAAIYNKKGGIKIFTHSIKNLFYDAILKSKIIPNIYPSSKKRLKNISHD